MASNALLYQGARIGEAQDTGALNRGRMAGQQIAASRQNMQAQRQDMGQRNALFQQQNEDRQRELQAAEQEKQIQAMRQDYAIFMQLPDDNARAQTWQQGLAQHYGQDPASDWKPVLEQVTRLPGFLPPELANRILADKFAPKQQEPFTLTPGAQRFGPDNKRVAAVPTAPEKAPSRRLVSVADPKSPTGFTYRPVEEAGGMPAPAPRSQQASARYSPKELQLARDKVRMAGVARQQLDRIKSAWSALTAGGKGAASAGPFGAGLLPTETGSNFDAAVDQFRSTITSLTRTPGVGAMSDYETRLDQSKLPTRRDYESSTAQKIQDLESFVNNLESGYGEILNDGQQGAAAPVQDIEGLVEDLVNKYAD